MSCHYYVTIPLFVLRQCASEVECDTEFDIKIGSETIIQITEGLFMSSCTWYHILFCFDSIISKYQTLCSIISLAFIYLFFCRCFTSSGWAKYQLDGQSPSTDGVIITAQSNYHGESNTAGPLPQRYRGCRGSKTCKKRFFEPNSHV